jgi:hypothetical protein
VLTVLALTSVVSAQSMGNGISKFTRGASNPKECLAFFEKYLSATEASDGCPDDKCECATQGRGQIDGSSINSELREVGGPPPGG